MTCGEIREHLELYALGVLESEERLEIDAHLFNGCDLCQTNLRRAIGVNSAVLMAAAPEVAPPAELRNRILASVRPPAIKIAREPARSFRWPVWAQAGAWAATAAALVGTVVTLRDRDANIAALRAENTTSRREADRLNQALDFLRAPETRPASATPEATQPRGTYFISPKGVLLIASNLPSLRAGQAYQMWVIPKGKAPKPAGLFRPDPTGGAVHFVAQPVDVPSAAALAITVEPEAGSAAPTTTPFLVTPVAAL